MEDDDGNDWLEFFTQMSDMADEGDEFDPDFMYIELLNGGKFAMRMGEDDPKEGTFKVDGKTVTFTLEGEDMTGTIEGSTIIIDDDGMTMVFDKNPKDTRSENVTKTDRAVEKIFPEEALHIIKQKVNYEDDADIVQLESEWAADVELYRFEIHWYGDNPTYDSVVFDSNTGEMEVEYIVYEYVQSMYDHWADADAYASLLIGKWLVVDATASNWYEGGEEVEFFAEQMGFEKLGDFAISFYWYVEIIDHFIQHDDIIPNLDPDQVYQLRMVSDEFNTVYYPAIHGSELHLLMAAGPPIIFTRIN